MAVDAVAGGLGAVAVGADLWPSKLWRESSEPSPLVLWRQGAGSSRLTGPTGVTRLWRLSAIQCFFDGVVLCGELGAAALSIPVPVRLVSVCIGLHD